MSNNQSRQNQQQSIPPTNQPLVDQLTHLLGQLTSVGEMTDARRKRLLDFVQQWEQNDPSTLGKVITAILTIVGSVIIGGTFTGILSIIFELNSLYVLYIIIQLTFIGFGVSLHFLSRSQLLVLASVILILIGLLASGGVALVPDQGISSLILFPLWIVTFVLLTLLMRSDGITYINLLMAEIYLFAFLMIQFEFRANGNFQPVIPIGIAIAINLLLLAVSYTPIKILPFYIRLLIQPILKNIALLVATLLAFVLTFEGIYRLGQDGISAWGTGLLTAYNLLFMVASGAMVWFGHKLNQRNVLIIGGIFWFAFLFYKYYDLFWELLHKSIFLSVLGLILIGISYLIQRNVTLKLSTTTEVNFEN